MATKHYWNMGIALRGPKSTLVINPIASAVDMCAPCAPLGLGILPRPKGPSFWQQLQNNPHAQLIPPELPSTLLHTLQTTTLIPALAWPWDLVQSCMVPHF